MERENIVPSGKATASRAYCGRCLTNCKVEILCVSEARWTASGRRILASGHTIFYSGRTDNLHRYVVAVIVTRKVEKTLYWNGQLGWTPALGLYL